jgi:hypothetical protein
MQPILPDEFFVAGSEWSDKSTTGSINVNGDIISSLALMFIQDL